MSWSECWLLCIRLRYIMKNIKNVQMLTFMCPLTSAIIIFSKANGMSCFHTRNLRLEKKNCPIKFFQCVRTKPHSSCFTNVEIIQATFVSSSRFNIEKKKGNIGNCKAFCVTSKYNKCKKNVKKYYCNNSSRSPMLFK